MSDDLIRESLEELYQDAPCGYIFTRPDGTFVRFNQTFLQWSGYSADNIAGKRFQDLLTVPGRIFYENQYAPLLHMQGAVTEISFDLRCSDGRRLPVLVNSTMRRSETGQPILIASTIFDASERERYEHELRADSQLFMSSRLGDLSTLMAPANVRTGVASTCQSG
jgi:PAS domain S-box-containing protein